MLYAGTKGAIPRRYRMSRAVVTRIPAGVMTPVDPEKIAKTGRIDRVPILKITRLHQQGDYGTPHISCQMRILPIYLNAGSHPAHIPFLICYLNYPEKHRPPEHDHDNAHDKAHPAFAS